MPRFVLYIYIYIICTSVKLKNIKICLNAFINLRCLRCFQWPQKRALPKHYTVSEDGVYRDIAKIVKNLKGAFL